MHFFLSHLDLESPLVSRIIRQENYSGSARTDYCCSRSNLRETSPLKLREVDDSETNNEGVTSPHKKKNNPLDKQGTTATVSSIPNLTLAPTDVVLTSGAITFRDPTTGAHFVQTQLLQVGSYPTILIFFLLLLLPTELKPILLQPELGYYQKGSSLPPCLPFPNYERCNRAFMDALIEPVASTLWSINTIIGREN